MQPIKNGRRKILTLFFIIIIAILIVSNFQWIGKTLYPIKFKEEISIYSEKYNVDPFLIAAIIRVESKYNKNALSPKMAKGLMQIAPITGKWAASELGIKNYEEELLYDPKINIEIGCWYISKLKSQFNSNIELVLAAYNGGSGNVTKWLANSDYSDDGENLKYIPFKETELYIKKVLKTYNIYKKLYSESFFN